MRISILLKLFKKVIKSILIFFGIFSLILIILSFTDIPYYAYHNLGVSNIELEKEPNVITILGGAGMPSPDGLIRTYYGADAALKYTNAEIIIALPLNLNDEDSLYQLNLMAHELIIRGVDSLRIIYEPLGYNTRSQAVNISRMYDKMDTVSMLIITSPEHMYRSVKSFKKIGFNDTGGSPSFEKPIDQDKLKINDDEDDIKVESLSARYNMWSYLKYELLVLREYIAIVYYKLKGWI